MQKPRYSVTRGRNGRFNFTLLSARGRIVGSVAIPVQGGQSRAAMDQAAERQIAALVGELVEAAEDAGRKTPREPRPAAGRSPGTEVAGERQPTTTRS